MSLEQAIKAFLMSTNLPDKEYSPKSSFMCIGLESEMGGVKPTAGEFTLAVGKPNPTLQLIIHDRLDTKGVRGVRTKFDYDGLRFGLLIAFCPITDSQKASMEEQSNERFGIMPVLEGRLERYSSNAAIGVFSE